jgi:hypothetical protein
MPTSNSTNAKNGQATNHQLLQRNNQLQATDLPSRQQQLTANSTRQVASNSQAPEVPSSPLPPSSLPLTSVNISHIGSFPALPSASVWGNNLQKQSAFANSEAQLTSIVKAVISQELASIKQNQQQDPQIMMRLTAMEKNISKHMEIQEQLVLANTATANKIDEVQQRHNNAETQVRESLNQHRKDIQHLSNVVAAREEANKSSNNQISQMFQWMQIMMSANQPLSPVHSSLGNHEHAVSDNSMLDDGVTSQDEVSTIRK